MNINQYAVYQLKESAELAAYRSRSYQYLTEHHFQVIVQNYQQAYFTKLFTSDTPEMITFLFFIEQFEFIMKNKKK